ncbi:MAG: hypothetical protein AAGN66_18115 [Acidobacteriota bacterium]
MNIGYKRLGIVIGAMATTVTVVLDVADDSRSTLPEMFVVAILFFLIHFFAILGVGWAHANFRNPNRVYSAGAKGVVFLTPLSVVAFLVFFVSGVSESESGFTLEKLFRLLSALAAPAFATIFWILGLTFSVNWVAEGFRKSSAPD